MSSESAPGSESGQVCDFCRHPRDDIEDVTVTDESGGGSARLCASCREAARATRCAFCGAVKSTLAKAEAVFFGLGDSERDADPVEICDDCRDRLLFRRGGTA